MKIGVLSSYAYICKVNNYGSLLQYFALQTYLTRCGYEVYWIRFNNKTEKKSSLISRYIRTKLFNSNFKISINHFNKDGFDSFIQKNINLSNLEYNSYRAIKKNPPLADLYIVGSDQVWSGYSPDRYLMFISHDKPKISYAVSFGKSGVKKYLKPLMWYYLKGFKKISVREKSGIKICYSVGRKDAEYVIDPTFLLTKNDYMEFVNKEKIKSESKPYIYSYFVNPFNDNRFPYVESFNELVEKTHCKIITTAIQGAEKAFEEKYIINPSPLKWIELIANADYVLTNSFHGMAFSIIMRKQFLIMPQKGVGEEQNNRQMDLLSTLELNNRVYNDNLSILEQIEKPINWRRVEFKINQFVNYSKEFLKTNLAESNKL